MAVDARRKWLPREKVMPGKPGGDNGDAHNADQSQSSPLVCAPSPYHSPMVRNSPAPHGRQLDKHIPGARCECSPHTVRPSEPPYQSRNETRWLDPAVRSCGQTRLDKWQLHDKPRSFTVTSSATAAAALSSFVSFTCCLHITSSLILNPSGPGSSAVYVPLYEWGCGKMAFHE
ncbi:uncharacterized protein V6R79_005981 [Siganus canaliculatus]